MFNTNHSREGLCDPFQRENNLEDHLLLLLEMIFC